MSMAAVARTRSLFRSSPLRNAAAKLAAQPKPTSPSSSKRVPLLSSPPRFLRTPVEMSCCVESLLPLHSATASAVLSSMLAVSRRSYGWLSDVVRLLRGPSETPANEKLRNCITKPGGRDVITPCYVIS